MTVSSSDSVPADQRADQAADKAANQAADEADAPAARSSDASGSPVRPRRHRRVVRTGVETEAVSGLSGDEAATGWSEPPAAGGDSNDEQLKRDVPPHW